MEWRVHPVTCPTVARAANAGVQLDTVANIMEAELLVAALDSYLMFNMVQHATGAVHLRCGEGPMPGLHLSLPQPTELPAPEYREMFLEDDGRVMTKGPKTYSQSGFIYRLIQFVRTMPSTYEWQLFFQLRKDWPRDSIWRQYTDDWQLQRRMFQDLDERPGVGPFSIDAGCDESGSNAQTTSFCTVVQDCLLQDWSGHNAWCNPPFSKILLILWHFLGYVELWLHESEETHFTVNAIARDTRSTYETGDKYGTIKVYLSSTTCLLAFGYCLQKANVTANMENAFSWTGVMLRKNIRFEGSDKLWVKVNFLKTNQFLSAPKRVCSRKYGASLLSALKADGQQVALTDFVFDQWLKAKLKAAGLQPNLYSEHSFRRGAATLAFG
eukprot:gene34023-biopygen4050